MILFWVLFIVLIGLAVRNFRKDPISALLFLVLAALWLAGFLVFGVSPTGVVD